MGVITIRRSNETDIVGVTRLLADCFGIVQYEEQIADVENGRYLLAVTTKKVVGMSGITESSNYPNGYPEVDWTCTDRDYRGCGVATTLIRKLIEDFHGSLYYSAWRVNGNRISNAHNIISRIGFTRIKSSHLKWDVNSNCQCVNSIECASYSGAHCKCCEDLWILNKR